MQQTRWLAILRLLIFQRDRDWTEMGTCACIYLGAYMCRYYIYIQQRKHLSAGVCIGIGTYWGARCHLPWTDETEACLPRRMQGVALNLAMTSD